MIMMMMIMIDGVCVWGGGGGGGVEGVSHFFILQMCTTSLYSINV